MNIALSPADTSEPPRLFNYLTAPHVLVWSAAAPCCPGPLAGSPQELLARSERGELPRYGANTTSLVTTTSVCSSRLGSLAWTPGDARRGERALL